ncbi:MAG: malate dehydrogenase [Coriobacteriia bacterium]|jgi:malate dehydrogenase|nr:malate dehydrogenase [Coriobacteriia bacterium]
MRMAWPKVTVVGAGQVGATTAFLLLTKGVADVVMIDVAGGLPQGKALDMMHSRSVERFDPVVSGTNDYADTAGSDVVVITAGLPRKPGMTRDDLLAANGAIVRSVVREVMAVSPDAIIICVTNPLDVMCYLGWKVSGLPHQRIFGMGGVLDSARFAYAIAEETGAPLSEITALAIGAHGDAMVPLARHSTVRGTPITELLSPARVESLVERTVFGGAEVVKLLKTGSAFHAPAASVVSMVQAVLSDAQTALPSCVYLAGEYGISDVYLSVPATLGRQGVHAIPELELDDGELAALRASAATVTEAVSGLGV